MLKMRTMMQEETRPSVARYRGAVLGAQVAGASLVCQTRSREGCRTGGSVQCHEASASSDRFTKLPNPRCSADVQGGAEMCAKCGTLFCARALAKYGRCGGF